MSSPTPAAAGHLVLDAEALYRELLQGVRALMAPTTRLAGIASGGAWLAERLHKDLGLAGAPGVLSSALHRDDFAQRGLSASAQTTLPFDVEGADILLLDDVLYTGRTLRAVLNELFDYGRPARVRLAVLVDRGGRQRVREGCDRVVHAGPHPPHDELGGLLVVGILFGQLVLALQCALECGAALLDEILVERDQLLSAVVPARPCRSQPADERGQGQPVQQQGDHGRDEGDQHELRAVGHRDRDRLCRGEGDDAAHSAPAEDHAAAPVEPLVAGVLQVGVGAPDHELQAPQPQGLARTVFEFQARDWGSERRGPAPGRRGRRRSGAVYVIAAPSSASAITTTS